MAIERITRVICDKCQATENVESFEIIHSNGKSKVDLCPDDRGPLAEVIKLAPRTVGRPGRKPGAVAKKK